ncbi:MAG: hypothetical protein HY675_18610 [Chloroflexi bacterium]|nr:hypothetical protein [Chloroflexota bacterium]
MIAHYLHRKYGGAVRVEYHDLARPEVREQHAGVWSEIQSRRMPMPVVAVDGEFATSGRIDYWDVDLAVDRKLREQSKAAT